MDMISYIKEKIPFFADLDPAEFYKKNNDIAYVRTQPTQDIFLAIGSDGTKKRVSMNIPVSKEISDVISNSAETQNKLPLMQKHTSVKAY